jgi:N-acetyl sugar amidotransferase
MRPEMWELDRMSESTSRREPKAPEGTRLRGIAKRSEYGRPLFDGVVRYCVRCCMPETAEGLAFDEMGICQPCRSSEQKIHMDWAARAKGLAEILETYRSKDGRNYDCIVPISGGKDSTFQLYVLTQVYGMRPLAVTFSHCWFTETGKHNLEAALEHFDVDHVMFTPRRSVVNKLAKISLPLIGDACWHCHAGVGSFPLQIAVKYRIPLLIWGESVSEEDGRATYKEPIVFDREYFTKISARYYAEELVGKEGLTYLDVLPYVLPTVDEIEEVGVRGIHLGDYIFWDSERQMEFVRDNFDWWEHEVEGTYKGYKSVECKLAGVHDYTKFLKRGFGRGTDHASQDVRAGLCTREEGFELAKEYDTQRPDALDYYLEITGYTEEELESVLCAKREGKAEEI